MTNMAIFKLDKHDLPWPRDYREAVAVQKSLVSKLSFNEKIAQTELVAGVDCASFGNTSFMVGAVVVWEQETGKIIDRAVSSVEADFPYIPGLLGFREIPAILTAFNDISIIPDVIICDGQGRAHQRGFGIACHLGLYVDIPTIGCGKSRLVGSYEEPSHFKGAWNELWYKQKIVGRVLCTKNNVKPVFVSAGNKCSLESATEIVLRCCRKYKLPEPIREAHKLCNGRLKGFNGSG